MVKRVLTQMQAGEIRRMRLELNDWGDPKWTGAEIAAAIGVSESTVWRVLNKQAAYAKMGKLEKGGLTLEAASAALTLSGFEGLKDEAAASAARVMERLKQPLPEVPGLERAPPPDLLAGGDSPAEAEGSALGALNERAAAYGLDIEKLRRPA